MVGTLIKARERENRLSTKHLESMNNQPCEYQIQVDGGYQCMTQGQYQSYEAVRTAAGDPATVVAVLFSLSILLIMIIMMFWKIHKY